MLDALLDLLAPPRCVACRGRGATPWCRRCAVDAERLAIRDGCARCGGPIDAPPEGAHAHCWGPRAAVTATVAAFRYTGPIAAAVVAGKANAAWSVWTPLGERLGRTLVAAGWIDTVARPLVTWVPADPRRRRTRGFDHAELLARAVARTVGGCPLRLLQARPGRPDQATRPLAQRRSVAGDAFRARAAPADVVLVDDVLTTGATAHAAALALRRAGAPTVRLAVVARAGLHPLGPS